MFEEDRAYEMQCEQDANYAQYMEEMECMSSRSYCSRCQTNWSKLHSMDGDGDEQYEFCPICRTAECLEAGKPGETFAMSVVTGQVRSDQNGRERIRPTAFPPEVPKKSSPFARRVPPVHVMEATEDKALDAYQKAYTAGGKEAGEKAYRAALKKGNS